jgi:hypothetical protein
MNLFQIGLLFSLPVKQVIDLFLFIRMTIADAGSEFIELMFPRYINQKKRIATS